MHEAVTMMMKHQLNLMIRTNALKQVGYMGWFFGTSAFHEAYLELRGAFVDANAFAQSPEVHEVDSWTSKEIVVEALQRLLVQRNLQFVEMWDVRSAKLPTFISEMMASGRATIFLIMEERGFTVEQIMKWNHRKYFNMRLAVTRLMKLTKIGREDKAIMREEDQLINDLKKIIVESDDDDSLCDDPYYQRRALIKSLAEASTTLQAWSRY